MYDTIKVLLESNSVRTVLAIAAIGVTIVLFLLNRKKKSLSYRVTRNGRLFRVSDTLNGRVQILVDRVPATNVSLVLIEVENSGNESIKPEDFYKPLRFRFDAQVSVLSAKVFATRPEDLDAAVAVDSNDVELKPLLLNRSDKVSIEVLLTNFNGKINHSARINGVQKIDTYNRHSRVSLYSRLSVLLYMVISLAAVMQVGISHMEIKQDMPWRYVAYLLGLGVGSMILFGSLLRWTAKDEPLSERNDEID